MEGNKCNKNEKDGINDLELQLPESAKSELQSKLLPPSDRIFNLPTLVGTLGRHSGKILDRMGKPDVANF